VPIRELQAGRGISFLAGHGLKLRPVSRHGFQDFRPNRKPEYFFFQRRSAAQLLRLPERVFGMRTRDAKFVLIEIVWIEIVHRLWACVTHTCALCPLPDGYGSVFDHFH
jgi:hypothetical protein